MEPLARLLMVESDSELKAMPNRKLPGWTWVGTNKFGECLRSGATNVYSVAR